MTQPARRHYTYAEYLELEAFSNIKHEFFGGEIYAMAGGTLDHAALAMAVGGVLRNRTGPVVSSAPTCACACSPPASPPTPT
jgi:hypothetical protein